MPTSKTKGKCAGNTPNTLILANRPKYENWNQPYKQKNVNRNGDLISDATMSGPATICIGYFTYASEDMGYFFNNVVSENIYLNKTSLLACHIELRCGNVWGVIHFSIKGRQLMLFPAQQTST